MLQDACRHAHLQAPRGWLRKAKALRYCLLLICVSTCIKWHELTLLSRRRLTKPSRLGTLNEDMIIKSLADMMCPGPHVTPTKFISRRHFVSSSRTPLESWRLRGAVLLTFAELRYTIGSETWQLGLMSLMLHKTFVSREYGTPYRAEDAFRAQTGCRDDEERRPLFNTNRSDLTSLARVSSTRKISWPDRKSVV